MKTNRLLMIPGLIAALALAATAQDAPPREIAAVLQPFVDRGEVAGAVALVADRDGVVGVDAVGHADIASGTPMRPDSVFWIASQSKPITATALMMLVDEGKVGLDDPVARHLPEFRQPWVAAERDDDHMLLRRPAHPITVRELLNHTSGLPFRSAIEAPTLDRLPLSVAAGSYAMTPLGSEPGAKHTYSNAGINTAGRIIEVASGMPYEDFLQARLFGPLGMVDTTFWPAGDRLARLATSYKPGKDKVGLEPIRIDQLAYPLDDRARRPMPAGGLFSTAPDLARFCRMILRGGELDGRRYLSESAVREMTRRQTGEAIPQSYGLGWATGGKTFGHGGAFATNMTIDPGRGLITIFLVQHAGFPGQGEKAQGEFRKAAEGRSARTDR